MKMRTHSPVALSALVFALLVSAASAQDLADPRGTSQMHVGPFYATPSMTVPEFGVDTNVFNSSTPQRDFTFTLAPKGTLWVPFAQRALLTTTAGADVVYYQRFSSERSINPQVRVRAEGSLGRFAPFAEGSYLNTRQRPNYEIDARVRRNEQGAQAGFRLQASQKMNVELAASTASVAFAHDAIYNDTALQQVLNRTTKMARLTVRHNLTPLTTLAMRVEAVSDRFEFSPLRNANSLRVMPGVELKPRALVSGTVYVGVRRFNPQSAALQDFSGMVANATLNYTLKTTTRFSFTADRDLTYSYEAFQPYFVDNSVGVTIARQLVGRLDATIGAQRHAYAYRNLLLPGANVDDLNRLDITHLYLGTVGYRFSHSARLGFGAAYRERDSTSHRFSDYRGFRFLTTLDYGF
jgi:hypothetical protein